VAWCGEAWNVRRRVYKPAYLLWRDVVWCDVDLTKTCMQAIISLVAWCGLDRAKTCMQANISLMAWCGVGRAKTCMQANIHLVAWRGVVWTVRRPVCKPLYLLWFGVVWCGPCEDVYASQYISCGVALCGVDGAKTCKLSILYRLACRGVVWTVRRPVCKPIYLLWRGVLWCGPGEDLYASQCISCGVTGCDVDRVEMQVNISLVAWRGPCGRGLIIRHEIWHR
jgi:hypothetical protein